MILIEEKLSNKLPNRTSLFFQIPQNLSFLVNQVVQLLPCAEIKSKTAPTIFELPITRLFVLINLFRPYCDVSFKQYEEPKRKLKKFNPLEYKVKPFKHQLEGIEYGINHDSWLLLDDQGLGKTLQMIYLAEYLHKYEGLEHCLIICGVNSLKFNWAAEIEKFSDLSYTILGQRFSKTGKSYTSSVKERCEILTKPIKEFFIITNIESLQGDSSFAKAFKKSKNKIDMIVLDEAHKAKNPTSHAAQNLLKLNAKHKIALTGTIIMNVPENAFVALKWTDNVRCTYSAFKNMYNVYGGYNNVQVIDYKNLDLLQEHISSCSLRRLKTDVLDLPERTFLLEYVEMGSKQQAIYDEVAAGIAQELDLLSKRKRVTIMDELVANTRSRQITAWPGILTTADIPSAKLDRLEDLVENITAQGDKVVVFCTFKAAVPEIERRLKQYNPVFCTGDESDAEITVNKNKFAEDKTCKVMVCTWQKMGTGHTLTAANYAIFIDTPWTDADFKQCADRIYRIGQNKKVFIITLITKHTYDERVLEILSTKETLSSYLIDKIDNKALTKLDNLE